MDFSYPKASRLISLNDFQNLKIGSRKIKSKFFIIYSKINSTGHTSRLGISVSKKQGNAVRRNRVKRITREVFRKLDFPKTNIDMLVIFSASKDTDIKDEVVLDLSSAFSKCFKEHTR